MLERITANIGVPWSEQTVDTFKEGDPDTPVTGIAVTMMATLDVLQREAAGGANLINSHEPTFYGHLDQLEPLEKADDAGTAAKRAFIRDRKLVALRRREVEVLVIGEGHEWETIDYVTDAAVAGQRKALIIVGHIPSEQGGHAGVRAMARAAREGHPCRIRRESLLLVTEVTSRRA